MGSFQYLKERLLSSQKRSSDPGHRIVLPRHGKDLIELPIKKILIRWILPIGDHSIAHVGYTVGSHHCGLGAFAETAAPHHYSARAIAVQRLVLR